MGKWLKVMINIKKMVYKQQEPDITPLVFKIRHYKKLDYESTGKERYEPEYIIHYNTVNYNIHYKTLFISLLGTLSFPK